MPGTDNCIKLQPNLRYEWKTVPNDWSITTRYDPQKTLQQLGTNAPVIQQSTQQTQQPTQPTQQQTTTPETPQQQTSSAQTTQAADEYINVFIKARPWTADLKAPETLGSAMLALPARNIPDLPGMKPRQEASDANFDKDRVQTTIGRDGNGKLRIPYTLRAQYGLQDAKPNSNYVLGLQQPKTVGALINVTGKIDNLKFGKTSRRRLTRNRLHP